MDNYQSKFLKNANIVIPGNANDTISFATKKWIDLCNECINKKGFFSVALSGGSTPKSIYKLLSSSPYKNSIDWNRVLLFWSDERNCPPSSLESNYHMAMVEGGLDSLGIPSEHIFRMKAESHLKDNASRYELILKKSLVEKPLDLVMLGMGADGHVASLFPDTAAITNNNSYVSENYVPKLSSYRMTLTYKCINESKNIFIYVIGEEKASTVRSVLIDHQNLPATFIGTAHNPAIWFLDEKAACLL